MTCYDIMNVAPNVIVEGVLNLVKIKVEAFLIWVVDEREDMMHVQCL